MRAAIPRWPERQPQARSAPLGNDASLLALSVLSVLSADSGVTTAQPCSVCDGALRSKTLSRNRLMLIQLLGRVGTLSASCSRGQLDGGDAEMHRCSRRRRDADCAHRYFTPMARAITRQARRRVRMRGSVLEHEATGVAVLSFELEYSLT